MKSYEVNLHVTSSRKRCLIVSTNAIAVFMHIYRNSNTLSHILSLRRARGLFFGKIVDFTKENRKALFFKLSFCSRLAAQLHPLHHLWRRPWLSLCKNNHKLVNFCERMPLKYLQQMTYVFTYKQSSKKKKTMHRGMY